MLPTVKFVVAGVFLAVLGGLFVGGFLPMPSDLGAAPGAVTSTAAVESASSSPATQPELPPDVADQVDALEARMPDGWSLPLVVREAVGEGRVDAARAAITLAWSVLESLQEADRLVPEVDLLDVVRPSWEAARTSEELEDMTDWTQRLLAGAGQVVGPLGELLDALPDGWTFPVVVNAALADQRLDDVSMAARAATDAALALAGADAEVPEDGILETYRSRYESAATVEALQELADELAEDLHTVRSDLIPGVDLVTMAVAPGVLQVVSDGVRDLTIPTIGYGLIDVAPDGNVWDFRTGEFYRLGDAKSVEGPFLEKVEVDARGSMWAVAYPGTQKTRDCPGSGAPHLVVFDGDKWKARLCNVGDFQFHPDGSPWVAVAHKAKALEEGNSALGRVRAGEWKKAGLGKTQAWGAVRPEGGVGGFAMLPPIALGPASPEGGWDAGWYIDDSGRLGWIALSGRTTGSTGSNTKQAWVEELGDGVLALGFADDRSSWVYVEHDEASLVDGTLTAEPGRYLVRFAPMADYSGQIPDQVGAYPVEAALAPPLPRAPRRLAQRLDVAPDGAVWLPTEDGLVRFDGQEREWYLEGQVISDLDIADDGTVWVRAHEPPGPDGGDLRNLTTRLFVITAHS